VKTTSGARRSSTPPAPADDGAVKGPERGTPAGARPSASRQGFAVGSDGTPIYYSLRGPLAPGPSAACLCDGIGCDGFVWKYLEPRLARRRPVVHFNYRGHGRTPLPRDPDRVTIADCADDLAGVLDAAAGHARAAAAGPRPAAFDKVVLIGHSMGVQVCLETLRRHPGRVAGLVLLCGSYGTPLRTFKNSRLLEDALPAIRLAIHAVPRAVTALLRTTLPTQLAYRVAAATEINGALVDPEDFMPYLRHMSQVDPRLFVDMLAAAGRHTARETLAEVRVPTLIVAGDQDGFTPLALSEEMHRLIGGSELCVIHGGTHTAPIERPDEVGERVGAFLDRLAAGAPPAAA